MIVRGCAMLVEAVAGLIENEDGTENYRIVALIDVTERERAQREEFSRQLRDKDMLLQEIQHRVKKNLQLTRGFDLRQRLLRQKPVDGDVRCMVAQEGKPPLRGRAISLGHVISDARLSDLRLFDLNCEANSVSKKYNSAIINH
jgi:hypothetical protein